MMWANTTIKGFIAMEYEYLLCLHINLHQPGVVHTILSMPYLLFPAAHHICKLCFGNYVVGQRGISNASCEIETCGSMPLWMLNVCFKALDYEISSTPLLELFFKEDLPSKEKL